MPIRPHANDVDFLKNNSNPQIHLQTKLLYSRKPYNFIPRKVNDFKLIGSMKLINEGNATH